MPEVLHYPGRVDFIPPELPDGSVNIDAPMLGPDQFGRRLVIASMDYDEATDTSTATLRAVLPDDHRLRIGNLYEQEMARERLRRLFGRG